MALGRASALPSRVPRAGACDVEARDARLPRPRRRGAGAAERRAGRVPFHADRTGERRDLGRCRTAGDPAAAALGRAEPGAVHAHPRVRRRRPQPGRRHRHPVGGREQPVRRSRADRLAAVRRRADAVGGLPDDEPDPRRLLRRRPHDVRGGRRTGVLVVLLGRRVLHRPDDRRHDERADGNFGPCVPGPLPTAGTSAWRFTGLPTAPSTNNAADYTLDTGALWTNNSRFIGLPPLFLNGFED